MPYQCSSLVVIPSSFDFRPPFHPFVLFVSSSCLPSFFLSFNKDLCIPGYSQIVYIIKDDLEPLLFLPLPPECLDYTHVLPHPTFSPVLNFHHARQASYPPSSVPSPSFWHFLLPKWEWAGAAWESTMPSSNQELPRGQQIALNLPWGQLSAEGVPQW